MMHCSIKCSIIRKNVTFYYNYYFFFFFNITTFLNLQKTMWFSSKIYSLYFRWKSLENSFTSLLGSQNMLFSEWTSYSTNFDLLSNWIENIQKILINFHLNKKFTTEEFNVSCFRSLMKDKIKSFIFIIKIIIQYSKNFGINYSTNYYSIIYF